LNTKLRSALQFIIFFGLGIGLMYWQFSKFDTKQKEDFFTALKTADYKWFALAIFIGALAHLSRAIRWQQLLHPLGRKAKLGNRYYAVMIGYLANYGLPRSGEFIRCGILKTSDDIPFSESFGTVMAERIVDTLCLLIIFITALLIEFSDLKFLWTKHIWIEAGKKISNLFENQTLVFILFGGFILIILFLFVFRKKLRSFFGGKIGAFLNGFKEGILAVRKVPKPGWFIFHSLFIWSGYLLALYVCFFCFPVTSGLNFNAAIVILLFGTFGVIFTPGGIGLYQIIVTEIVAYLLQLTVSSEAAPYAWLSWGAQLITVIIFCGVSVLIKPVLNRMNQ